MRFFDLVDIDEGLTFIIYPPFCSDPSGASAPPTPVSSVPPTEMQICPQYTQFPWPDPSTYWVNPQYSYPHGGEPYHNPPSWSEPAFDYTSWYAAEQNQMRNFWFRMSQPSTSAPPNCSSEMICAVCGDKAEGYHFGAVSCAACGAFFRRSIAEQKLYHCQRRNCSVEFESFKRTGACRYCRFEKCLESGMLTLEVQAKRNRRSVDTSSGSGSGSSGSSGNSEKPPAKRKLNVSSTIEQTVNLKRDLAATAGRHQDRHRGHFNDFRESLSVQFERFKKLMRTHSSLQKLCPDEADTIQACTEWFGLSQDSRGYDLFFTFYVFELIWCTITEGGVQLDRICFPGGFHVEITLRGVEEFLSDARELSGDCLIHSFRDLFFFVVRTCGKHIQGSHYDETETAILFYTSLFFAARPSTMGPDRTLFHNILTEMSTSMEHVGADFSVRLGMIILSMREMRGCLEQVKEMINLVSLYRKANWNQNTTKIEEEEE